MRPSQDHVRDVSNTSILTASWPGNALWGRVIARIRSAAAWRFGPAWKPHRLPLLLLSAVILLTQAVFFASAPTFIAYPDSAEYLSATTNILVHGQVVAPLRTPGYPLLLSLIFAIDTGRQLGVVIGVQTVLMIATTYEGYLLAFRLTRNPPAAAVMASLLAANFYFIDWQYTILTETLAFWAVVTLFLIAERVLTRPRRATWVWFAVLCVVVVMVRPFYVYLPAVLLFGLGAHAFWRRRRQADLRSYVVALGLSGVAVYACVAGYIILNGALNGYPGLSYVSNVNIFGKVIEFDMQDLPVSPALTPIQQAAASSTHGRENLPWAFARDHGYDRDYYAPVGAYGRYVALHYPLQWSIHVAADVGRVWLEPPFLYAPIHESRANLLFRLMGRLTPATYAVLPLLAIVWVALVVRQRNDLGDSQRFMLLLLLLGVVASVVMVALGTYFEFYRIREPTDWAAIFVVAGMGYELGVGLARQWIARWRARGIGVVGKE